MRYFKTFPRMVSGILIVVVGALFALAEHYSFLDPSIRYLLLGIALAVVYMVFIITDRYNCELRKLITVPMFIFFPLNLVTISFIYSFKVISSFQGEKVLYYYIATDAVNLLLILLFNHFRVNDTTAVDTYSDVYLNAQELDLTAAATGFSVFRFEEFNGKLVKVIGVITDGHGKEWGDYSKCITLSSNDDPFYSISVKCRLQTSMRVDRYCKKEIAGILKVRRTSGKYRLELMERR